METDKKSEDMLHEQIMSKLSKVRGYESTMDSFEGNLYCWKVEALLPNEALEIAKRGRHDEIMYMIHQYGKAAPMYDWTHGKAFKPYEEEHILPSVVQAIIAERCDWDEVMTYASYQGFGEYAQTFFMKHASHELKMAYLEKHGLTPINQMTLVDNGNEEEYFQHLKFHGFCREVEERMLARHNFDDFKRFLDCHELSVGGQSVMCRTLPTLFFMSYIERYGLWEDAHEALILFRSEDEITEYVMKHRHLSEKAEKLLCKKRKHRVIMTYIWHKWASPMSLIAPLRAEDEIDYLAILAILEREKRLDDVKEIEVELMKKGTKAQIEEYRSVRQPNHAAEQAYRERIRRSPGQKL